MHIQGGLYSPNKFEILNHHRGNTERYRSQRLQNLYTVEQTTFELQITDIGLTSLSKF